MSREAVEARKAAADKAGRTFKTTKPDLSHNDQQMHLYLVSGEANRAIKRRALPAVLLQEEASSGGEEEIEALTVR